jgi:hypothetical protein
VSARRGKWLPRSKRTLAMGLLIAGLGALAISGVAFLRAPKLEPPAAQCLAGLRAQGWATQHQADGVLDARRRLEINDYGTLLYEVDAALGACGGLSVHAACVGADCGPVVTLQFQKRG